ncbi:MAG: glycosyltransferase family 39 protein [Candidatus Solibacter usitatus]|nr:glycosyltransferase family 39 protein [Candidatus Solibacter usitatus]
MMLPSARAYLPGILACLLFTLLGVVFIPYAGAQYDEVLFVTAIHNPAYIEYSVPTRFGNVPVMLMTYIGTLKAAIYAPILHFLGATHATLRLPVLLFGAVSVWLFYLTLRRLAGTTAAALAALLLATDALYLLTCVFDWGPVALQHLLFTAAIYFLVRFAQQPRARWLFAGAFCAGLALWDKALFVWTLAPFFAALLVLFPRRLWDIARNRRQAAALLAGFVLGAAPLLYYNVQQNLKTFTANTQVDEPNPLSKLVNLDRTLDGSGLLGYLVRDNPEGPPQNLRTWEKPPLFLNGVLGNPRQSMQHILLVAALLAAPLLCWFGPNRRAALLFVAGGTAAYLMMMFTRSAGGSVHHTVLLWPLPQMALGLVAGEAVRRWPGRGRTIAASAILVCALSNLAVLNSYLAHFIACGPTAIWSDAIRPLVADIGTRPGRLVFAVDWGIAQQVEFYGNGRIGYHRSSDGIVLGLPDELSVRPLEAYLANPATLFVTHTEGREAFIGVRQRMLEFASARGYRDEILKVIHDRHGAPIFEIHEFRK